MRKSATHLIGYRKYTMETEHINLIGSTLEDLAQRTQALRGYL